MEDNKKTINAWEKIYDITVVHHEHGFDGSLSEILKKEYTEREFLLGLGDCDCISEYIS